MTRPWCNPADLVSVWVVTVVPLPSKGRELDVLEVIGRRWCVTGVLGVVLLSAVLVGCGSSLSAPGSEPAASG